MFRGGVPFAGRGSGYHPCRTVGQESLQIQGETLKKTLRFGNRGSDFSHCERLDVEAATTSAEQSST